MKATLVALIVWAAPAAAQANALVFFTHAGRATSLVELGAGSDFAPGFSLGGGLALQLGARTALRAGFARVETEFRGTGTGLTDPNARRSYVSLDVQAGWPGTSGMVPYVLVGGGAVRTDPAQDGAPSETHLGGRLGAGVNLIGGPVVLFGEALAWAYEFSGYGFERVQVDLIVQAGAALAIPF